MLRRAAAALHGEPATIQGEAGFEGRRRGTATNQGQGLLATCL